MESVFEVWREVPADDQDYMVKVKVKWSVDMTDDGDYGVVVVSGDGVTLRRATGCFAKDLPFAMRELTNQLVDQWLEFERERLRVRG